MANTHSMRFIAEHEDRIAAHAPFGAALGLVPVPPFLANKPLQPAGGDSSASPALPLHLAFASTENAKWWLAHLESLMAAPVQGCELPPPTPKPPKLELVKPAPRLAPMVLDRASLSPWGQALYTAHNAHPGSPALQLLINKGTPVQESLTQEKAAA